MKRIQMSPNEKPVFWANSIRLNEPERILRENGWQQGSRPAASDFNWLFNEIQKDIHDAKSEIGALKEKLRAEATPLEKKLTERMTSTVEIKRTAEHALKLATPVHRTLIIDKVPEKLILER